MWEREVVLFWRENLSVMVKNNIHGGYGRRYTWPWTWTFAVLLLILTYRLLISRLRFLTAAIFAARRSVTAAKPAGVDQSSVPDLRTQGIVSDLDLKNLIDDLNENSANNVSVIWENVVEKSNNSVSYKAKCCKNKDGALKYLSVTMFEDCSVEALVGFYMDNHYRMQWDKTVVSHEQLQLDQSSGTEIGRTIKKFPFLTPREYVLAWKLWQGMDGSFYCFSKECEHPLAPKQKRYIRVSVFRSGWRIRKVPGRSACEIRMVHQEDAGLNVEMAKLAFAKGIWSYVCKMDGAFRKYSAERQHQLNMSIQKVPPEFETTNGTISAIHPTENSTTTTVHLQRGNLKSKFRKLTRSPSSKLIRNGLVLLGGAICLSRGHSSLGAKVAMAYMLSKLTKHGVPGDRGS